MNLFRFPTPLSVVLVAAGMVTALGGGAFALKTFLEPGGGWMKIGGAVAVAVAGLLVIACGEIIGVVYAIEEGIQSIDENTRKTNELFLQHMAGDEKAPEMLVRPRLRRM